MAGFDTSNVAAQAGQGVTPINPLQMMEQVALTRNLLNQNRMFQSQQAVGQAAQQAIDPNTGAYDPSRANAFMAADPTAAIAAPGALAANQAYGVSAQGLAASRIAAMKGAVASIQAPPAGAPQPVIDAFRQRYAATLNAGVAQGMWTADDAANASGGNIAGLAPADIVQMAATQVGNPTQKELQFGVAGLQNTGGQLTPTRTTIGPDGETEARIAGAAPIPMTLPPGVVNTPAFTRYNPATHQMETVTQGQAAANPPVGAIASAPPLGAEAAYNTAGIGSAQQLNTARAASLQATPQIFALEKALQGLKGSNTGPGTAQTNQIASFLKAQTPFDLGRFLPGVDPDKIANYDEANKYLTAYASGMASSMGEGTDAKLAAAFTGNASTHISSLAAVDVARSAVALQRMQQAGIAAFDRAGQPGGPAAYSQFATTWARSVDPRAFGLDMMTPAERQKMLSNVTTSSQMRSILVGKQSAEQAGLFAESDIPR